MRTGGWIFAPSVREDDLNGWGKIIRGKDKKRTEEHRRGRKNTEKDREKVRVWASRIQFLHSSYRHT